MLWTSSIRSRGLARRAALCPIFLTLWIGAAVAQEPPLDVPKNRLPATPPNDAIAVDQWLLYPTVRVYSLYSDNLFQAPVNPLSVLGFGMTPSLTAEWSNGIHATTLYGNIDRQVFPTDNEVNTFDRQAGFTQKYEALRDLTFSVRGDYTHKTYSSGLQSSIPTALAGAGTTVLPNGNTLLPNGTILSPSGQPVGQAPPAVAANPLLSVNPYDQFTSTFSVDKIFNRGILSLSGSVVRTEYDMQSAQDLRTKTLGERAGVWLGPLFYAYSDGLVANAVPVAPLGPTTSYRVLAGIGTRQFGLLRSSAYFGHQGSQTDATASSSATRAGGDIYGAKLTYYPDPALTLGATVDETINISSQALPTNLALTLPAPTPIQIPLSASTRITSAGFQSNYKITQRWSTNWNVGFTRIEYVASPRLDNTWLLDATLRYDIWRNMAITWEYRYTSILSNAPLVSATSNFGTIGMEYKF
jgi:hypothetical protein